ncbi:MAG: hypothetical protein OSB60_15530, partial [Myxococcota bacterium]|nr:hypothetical protein [Myxococcota bacterium]
MCRCNRLASRPESPTQKFGRARHGIDPNFRLFFGDFDEESLEGPFDYLLLQVRCSHVHEQDA